MGGYIIIIDDSCRVTRTYSLFCWIMDVRFTVRIKQLTVCGGRWDAKQATATLMAQLTYGVGHLDQLMCG